MPKTLEEEINRAAAELPEDWIIEICVEHGSGCLTLYDCTGNNCGFQADGPLVEQVTQAIEFAKENR